MRRGQHQVHALAHLPARLEQQEPAQFVGLRLKVPHLVEHGLAGHVDDAARDDLVELAFGMNADDVDHSAEAHGVVFRG